MKIKHQLYFLDFKHPFGVSSNTRTQTPSVFLELECEGVVGYGEACLPAYLGETVGETQAFFEACKRLLEDCVFPMQIAEVMTRVDALSKRANAAKAAIDMALHDLVGKARQKSVAEMYGTAGSSPKRTSFTIGIDMEEVMVKKIQDARDFSILKIKAGTANDRALIEAVRRCTDKPLFVDVNQGWTDKHKALEMAHFMKDQHVLLLEQPMPVSMKQESAWLSARSPVPTFADESAKRLSDLDDLKGVFSGINIKLMKSAGILEAIKMVEWCGKNDMQVMLGCMAESSCATSAMAQLADLADYIDLDAPLLYKNDPFSGVSYLQGTVVVSGAPGIAANPRMNLFSDL